MYVTNSKTLKNWLYVNKFYSIYVIKQDIKYLMINFIHNIQ